MMKDFIKKSLVFLLPILMAFTFPFLVLKTSKEYFNDIDSVISNFKKDYLIGFSYDESPYKYIKWKTLESKKHTAITLGSSRVLQFRKNMFDVSFYNAGYTISNINEFKPFLKSIPKSKLPEFLIIGLDQWMFNENWSSFSKKNIGKSNWTSYPNFNLASVSPKIYSDFFNNKYNFETFRKKKSINKIGINAFLNNTGFRNDGSMLYGKHIDELLRNSTTDNDIIFEDTKERISKGVNRFEYGNFISQFALNELNQLLVYCNNHNIKVIGFLPPFPNTIHKQIKDLKKYKYIAYLGSEVSSVFKKHQHEFYDYSSLENIDYSSDNEFIDGFHGSEVSYARILLDMLAKGSCLNKICSSKKLKNDLSNRKNRYTIY